ncbi:hypothetical protein ABDB91_18570 [Desulfoscipio sp. XC116]|uniref:hypothetical protein n=1 Tax=Desulfoscipio sp. XC116 TaxID=3144975 RepID=UPI00325AB9A7
MRKELILWRLDKAAQTFKEAEIPKKGVGDYMRKSFTLFYRLNTDSGYAGH